MPFISSIGTYVPCWGAPGRRTPDHSLFIRTAARVSRSLPVRTRNAVGVFHDYGDRRLSHERGLVTSLESAWLGTPDSVGIGDRGRLVLCRIAVRQGVPDYGYAFQPESEAA